jgi:hypothetical protein
MADLSFKAGHIFFRSGDAGDRAYLIQEGEVELLSGPPDNFQRVSRFGPKDVFGDMSLIEERPRHLTARAITAGTARSMSRTEFERLLTEDPAECIHYLQSLFERLRNIAHRQEAKTEDSSPGKKMPLVAIYPISKKAEDSLPPGGFRIPKFPFRIGRASEAHEPEPLDLNDMWLIDTNPFNVSRNHLAIELNMDGDVIVIDRGSHLGTLVNDELLGRSSPSRRAPLNRGNNTLVVGSRDSPYKFRVVVDPPE